MKPENTVFFAGTLVTFPAPCRARVCRNYPLWPAYTGLSDGIMLPKSEGQEERMRKSNPAQSTG
jgi:hypothetical protein